MAQVIIILGQSGTGKSYSMINFADEDVCVISAQKSMLPFRKRFTDFHLTDSYSEIKNIIKHTNKKTIVIDDAQYLMSNCFMRRILESGYTKYSEMGRDFWDLISVFPRDLPDDMLIFILSHIQINDNGNESIKTIGKLLDEKICLEGLVNTVLKTAVSDGQYSFLTQNSGKDTCKSPSGMFDYKIQNDLKYVDSRIRWYYGLDGAVSDSEIQQQASAVSIQAEKATRPPRTSTSASQPAQAQTGQRDRRLRRREEPAQAQPAPASAPNSEPVPPVETPVETPTSLPDNLAQREQPASQQVQPASQPVQVQRRPRRDRSQSRQSSASDALKKWDAMLGNAPTTPDAVFPSDGFQGIDNCDPDDLPF